MNTDSQELSAKVLGIHPEPCVRVDEATVHRLLTVAPAQYLAAVSHWLTLLAEGSATLESPPKWIWSDTLAPDGGDFRVMPCVVRHGPRVVKTVKLVGTNRRQQLVPDQITVGKAFHLHPRENFITHVFEACLLSSARTGLCGALALSRLAPGRKRIAIIGAGRVGYYAACYARQLAGVEEITLRDLELERAENAAALAGTSCRAERLEAPLKCDALVLATSAREAFCHPRSTDASVVVSLGADTADQHELAPDWARTADVYVDGPDCLQVGDVRAWRAAGLVREPDLVPLLELWRHGPRSAPGRKRVFVSTGSALLDNLTIVYLLERLAG